MTKKQIRLNENELKSLIRESVINFLNENMDKLSDRENDIMRGYWSSVDDMRMPKQKYPFDEKPKKSKWELGSVNEMDELTPGFAIHAAHAAAEDKKKHPGRGKNSSDPAIRAKRDAQIKKFGDYAADAINNDMNDPDSMVIGDRGARRMMVANGPHSAYLTNDLEDIDSAKVYDDNFQDGGEPMAIADLKEINPEFYAKIHKNFATFKGHHDKAKELDDEYLEETVKNVVKKVLNEIGDTPRGLYALSAVQGRAMKRMHNAMANGDKTEYEKQRNTFDNSDDAVAASRRNLYNNPSTYDKDVTDAENKGFQYGCRKANGQSINEIGDTERGQYMIGRAAGRRIANGAKLSRNADNNGTNPFYAKASVAMRQKGSDENLKGNEIYAYGSRQANNSKDLDDFSKKSNALNKGFNDELKKYK